jgi:hypothetical protein
LPDLVFLAILKPFFFLTAGSRIFLFLSEVVVFFAELSLVLCLPPHHHHHHHHHHHRFHGYLVLQAVLECVLPSQLLLSGEPQILLLRTMCGSRTGGWSLPCVMSD